MALFSFFKKAPMPASAANQELLEIQKKHTLQVDKAEQFWRDFLKEKDRLLILDMKELVTQAGEMVHQYFEGVVIEIEQDTHKKFNHLVFSANGIVDRFNDIMLLVKLAPKMQGLTVSAFRQRVKANKDFKIGMGGFDLAAQDVLMKLLPYKGRVELEIGFAKEVPSEFFEHAQNMALILMDHVVGEYDVAIKIGEINFQNVTVTKEQQDQWMLLPDVPQALDHMWVEELKHTQIFPMGEHEWLSFQFSNKDDEKNVVVGMLNQSAIAVACRADMGVCLDVTVDVPDKESMNQIYEYEDALNAQLMNVQMGLHVLTLFPLQEKRRTMTYYVFDEQDALRQAIEIAKRFPELKMTYKTEYDYRWNTYLSWLPE